MSNKNTNAATAIGKRVRKILPEPGCVRTELEVRDEAMAYSKFLDYLYHFIRFIAYMKNV